MAEILQKVFQVHVRPWYTSTDGSNTFRTYYKGDIYGGVMPLSTNRYPLTCGNETGAEFSEPFINKKMTFKKDAWFLHSTYTSYEDFRTSLKELLREYGTDNVRASIYIPIDFEVLPNQ